MEQAKLQKWNCVGCHRNVICKPHTLALLGWRLFTRGPICPECRQKEEVIKYSSNFGGPILSARETDM
jgi:hypothetical protein